MSDEETAAVRGEGEQSPRERNDRPGGMEHRWRVYVIQIWPRYVKDWTEVSAESRQEALDKVSAGMNRRCTLPTDWKFDPDRPAEMVL